MRISSLLAVVVIAAALCTSSQAVEAQRAKRVGIVVSVAVNVPDEESYALSAALGAAVQKEFEVEVISGEETKRRLPPDGLPDECIASSACRTDIGRRLDSEELLMLVIVRLGDEIQIDSSWAHIASGDIASRPKITIAAGSDKEAIFAKAAPTLFPHLTIKKPEPLAPREIVLVSKPSTEPPGREMPTSGWVAAGVSATTLVAATVFAVSARQKFTSLDNDGCREIACDQSRISSFSKTALTADVLFGVSGAAAATALVLYLVNTPDEKAPQQALLRQGPGLFGLAVGGQF